MQTNYSSSCFACLAMFCIFFTVAEDQGQTGRQSSKIAVNDCYCTCSLQ